MTVTDFYRWRGDRRFSMRVVTPDDLPLLAAHRNHPGTWMNLTSPLPVMPHRQERWLESLSDENMYFIGRFDDDDVALLRLTDIDWQNRTAAVGLDVFEAHRGKGLATPMMMTICSFAFEELDLYRLWLLVLATNHRAIKVYRNVGFTVEGRMRQHIYRNGDRVDYILMGMLRGEMSIGDDPAI